MVVLTVLMVCISALWRHCVLFSSVPVCLSACVLARRNKRVHYLYCSDNWKADHALHSVPYNDRNKTDLNLCLKVEAQRSISTFSTKLKSVLKAFFLSSKTH